MDVHDFETDQKRKVTASKSAFDGYRVELFPFLAVFWTRGSHLNPFTGLKLRDLLTDIFLITDATTISIRIITAITVSLTVARSNTTETDS